MTTNATVEARHKDEAAGIALMSPGHLRDWIAQTLANLEAARAENADLTNRLAENNALLGALAKRAFATLEPHLSGHRICIGFECQDEAWDAYNAIVRALASGHTPSPCPRCAAKDEAMAAFRREVSEAVLLWQSNILTDIAKGAAALESFIIPPADPVAEALVAKFRALPLDGDSGCDKLTDGEWAKVAEAALAELKSRLGGAK